MQNTQEFWDTMYTKQLRIAQAVLSETFFRGTGCLNWARPGLWGLRVGDCPVLPGYPAALLRSKEAKHWSIWY